MNQPNNESMVTAYFETADEEQNNHNFIVDLRHAIKNSELSVNYQPRYNTTTNNALILEALVRWNRKDFGNVPSEKIISEACKHDLIFMLDLWVFDRCCRDLIYFKNNINSNLKIAVNICPIECENSHHTQKLLYICGSHGLNMSSFEFEITESECINDPRKIKKFCDTVIEHGASVSLDDFGTCYSPLAQLCELPINYIKIDRRFTDKIGCRSRSEILITHLIKLAHDMGIKVVAEGIEHAFQRDHLIDVGCDQLQGFYMCKPLERDLITENHLRLL